MTKDYWSIEIQRADQKDRTDDDLRYYGCEGDKAFESIFNTLCKKDVAYMLYGKAQLEGESRWPILGMYGEPSGDELVIHCWEDDDGSGESLDD